jgi:hypothetical protein
MAILCAGLALAGCGGQGQTVMGGSDPLMTITNSWSDEADATHQFNLTSTDDGQSIGRFTGQEQLGDGSSFDLTGSWGHGQVTFTVNRNAPVTYSSSFVKSNPSRLIFRSGSRQLTLVMSTLATAGGPGAPGPALAGDR